MSDFSLPKMRFAYKIGLLPALAAVGFVSILATSAWLGSRTEARLNLIERGYYPSGQLSRDLAQTLAELQRTMQDAVAATDVFVLDQADSLSVVFQERLQRVGVNPVLGADEIDRIGEEFDAYYAAARIASERLITGERGESIVAALEDMGSRYNVIKDGLNKKINDDAAATTAGFAAARSAQTTSKTATTVMTVIALILLVSFSHWIIKNVNASVTAVSRGFAAMSAGDFTQKVSVSTDDEIGDLGRQMNELIDRMSELLGGVLRVSRTLAGASDELSVAVVQMQKGSMDQSSSTEQTSSALVH